jgi:hypothetical protein
MFRLYCGLNIIGLEALYQGFTLGIVKTSSKNKVSSEGTTRRYYSSYKYCTSSGLG